MPPVWIAVILWLVIINLTAFAIFGIDKKRAKKGQWRIPEKTLFLSAILGGSIGAILGMYIFHHKTKHWYFQIGIPAIMIIQIAAVYWLSQKGVITLPFAP